MRGFRRSGRRDGSKTTASNLRVSQPRPRLPAFGPVPLPFASDACQIITTTSVKGVVYAPSCARGTYWCILALVLAQLTSGGEVSTASPPSRLLYVNTTFDSTLGFPYRTGSAGSAGWAEVPSSSREVTDPNFEFGAVQQCVNFSTASKN